MYDYIFAMCLSSLRMTYYNKNITHFLLKSCKMLRNLSLLSILLPGYLDKELSFDVNACLN